MSPTATSQQKETSHYWAPPLSISKDQLVSPLQKVTVAPQEGSEKLTACEHEVLKVLKTKINILLCIRKHRHDLRKLEGDNQMRCGR